MSDRSERQTAAPGRSPVTGVLPWLGVGLLLAATGVLLWRAGTEERLVQFDVRQAWLPSGLACLWGVMGLARPGGNRRAAWCLIAASAILAATALVLDQFNLLVEYHRWLERGMPAPWQWGGGAPKP
ncbi:MAG: hypothetical protein NT031_07725 [Planctomycetota bacterium]|nr:hypothetical protein [Planctomycetota bacterium]